MLHATSDINNDATSRIERARDIVLEKLETRFAGEMFEIAEFPRHEVVRTDDAVSIGELAVDHVGAEEAGSSGY